MTIANFGIRQEQLLINTNFLLIDLDLFAIPLKPKCFFDTLTLLFWYLGSTRMYCLVMLIASVTA